MRPGITEAAKKASSAEYWDRDLNHYEDYDDTSEYDAQSKNDDRSRKSSFAEYDRTASLRAGPSYDTSVRRIGEAVEALRSVRLQKSERTVESQTSSTAGSRPGSDSRKKRFHNDPRPPPGSSNSSVVSSTDSTQGAAEHRSKRRRRPPDKVPPAPNTISPDHDFSHDLALLDHHTKNSSVIQHKKRNPQPKVGRHNHHGYSVALPPDVAPGGQYLDRFRNTAKLDGHADNTSEDSFVGKDDNSPLSKFVSQQRNFDKKWGTEELRAALVLPKDESDQGVTRRGDKNAKESPLTRFVEESSARGRGDGGGRRYADVGGILLGGFGRVETIRSTAIFMQNSVCFCRWKILVVRLKPQHDVNHCQCRLKCR